MTAPIHQPLPDAPSRPTGRSAPWPLMLLLATAAALYAVFIFRGGIPIAGRTYYCLFDDAMISMRYARHLAGGMGFVWNPGEPPIEGFTNLLWTLLMAGAHILPIPDSHTSLLVMLLGAAIMLANGAAAWRLAGAVSCESLFVKTAAAALTLFSYPLMFWTLRGMEVGLLALLVTVMAWQTIRLYHLMGQFHLARRRLAVITVCMILALLTRPDALAPILVTAFIAAVVRPAGAMRWRTAQLMAAVIFGVMGAMTLWRVLYFGDPLPNTYYLKMTGIPLTQRVSNGVRVFLELLLDYGFWLPAAIAAGGLIWDFKRRVPVPTPLLLAGLCGAMIAYSIYVGGDAWEFYEFPNRYIATTLPVMFVLIARAGGALRFIPALARRPRAAAAASWTLLAILLLHQNYAPFRLWIDDGFEEQRAHEINTRTGLILRAGTAPDALIAVYWAGAIPYFSRRPIVDLLGKNDRVIARQPVRDEKGKPGHAKWDYQHSFGDGRPNVVAQLWRRWKEDYQLLEDAGYVKLPSGMFVHPGDPAVSDAILSTDYRDAAAVDKALAAPAWDWR